MDKEITSYNTRVSNDVRRLLLPSKSQIILDFTIATLLLAVFNLRAIWQYITTGTPSDSQVDLGSLLAEKIPTLESVTDVLTHGRLIQILFWLFIGCVAYIVIWFFGSLITNIRNDIVADEYTHPQSYNRHVYWGSVFTRKILFATLSFIFIAYLYAGLKLMALLAVLCRQYVMDFHGDSLAVLLGAVLASVIIIRLGLLVLRLVINSWQLIYKDL